MPETSSSVFRILKTPEAVDWAEWQLLVTDIEYAQERVILCLKAQERGESAIAESLFRDFVITFVSCFDTSVQRWLDRNDTYSDTSGALECLSWLEDLRHGWIAHRHGPARQCIVGCVADMAGNKLSRGHLMMHFCPPMGEELAQLFDLAEIALNCAKAKLEVARVECERQLEALPPNRVTKLPIGELIPPEASEHRIGRAKVRNRKGFRRSIPPAGKGQIRNPS